MKPTPLVETESLTQRVALQVFLKMSAVPGMQSDEDKRRAHWESMDPKVNNTRAHLTEVVNTVLHVLLENKYTFLFEPADTDLMKDVQDVGRAMIDMDRRNRCKEMRQHVDDFLRALKRFEEGDVSMGCSTIANALRPAPPKS